MLDVETWELHVRTCELLSSVGVDSQPYLSPGPFTSHMWWC